MQDRIEQKSKQYKSNVSKGFTFVELVISMTIIAILSVL
jgi:prepilin-type N-terminal cleavage/methylation domain-containing protein